MPDEVLLLLQAGVLDITINRPDRANALDAGVLRGLREALHAAAGDPAVRVVTLSGVGDRVFCAGADLKSALGSREGGLAFQPADYRALIQEILDCPKPTVALARGHVMAGGIGILLACDLALACDDIHFSTPEIHVGMYPMMVLSLLYRHVGRKRAAEMLLLGDRIPASTARDFGIINRAVPRDRFEAEAGRTVRGLAEKSSAILRLGKEAAARVAGRGLQEDLEYLESALSRVMACSDSKEGLTAFLEKRKPHWKDE